MQPGLTLGRTVTLVVLLAAAALLFLWLGSWVEPDTPSTTPSEKTDESRSSPELRGSGELEPLPSTREEAEPIGAGAPPTGPATVEVYVRDDEHMPLEGAKVTLWQTRPRAKLGEGSTNAGGRVVFQEIPLTNVKAYATLAQHRRAKGEVTATLVPVTIELELIAWPVVHGAVVAAGSGRPLPGAVVALTKGGSHGGRTHLVIAPEIASVVADADGRFELPVPWARTLTLAASHDGYADTSTSVHRTEEGKHVILRLPPGGTLTGTVTNADGSRCPGAHVFVVPASDKKLVENPRKLIGENGGAVWGDDGVECSTSVEGEGAIRRARRTTTNADGRYEIGGLALPQTWRVLAESPDSARGGANPFELTEASPTADVDVRLQATHVLVVRVAGTGSLFLEGPVAGFLEPRTPGDVEWGLDGEPVRIPALPQGTYALTVKVEGSSLLRRTIEIGDSPEHEVTLEPDAGVALVGIVAEPDGQPASKVKLAWLADDDCGVFGRNETVSDDQGRFEIPHLRPVPGGLRVRSDHWIAAPLEAVTPGAETVRVVVRRPPVLEARFVRPAGSSETRDPWVAVQSGEHTLECKVFKQDGRGILRIPLPVETRVHVMFGPYGGAYVLRGPYTARAGDVIDAGDVLFTEGRKVHGRVTDREGKPIEGAKVKAAFPGLPEHMSLMNPVSATTKNDGTFELTGVHEGPAVLRVRHGTYVARPQEVGDPSDEVHIIALKGARVWCTLHENRQPVRLTPLDEDVSEARDHFPDEYGRLRIGPLLPGRYRVTTAPTHRRPEGVETEEIQELEVFELTEGEMKHARWAID